MVGALGEAVLVSSAQIIKSNGLMPFHRSAVALLTQWTPCGASTGCIASTSLPRIPVLERAAPKIA